MTPNMPPGAADTAFLAIKNNIPETVAALKRHRFTLNPFRYLFQRADRAYIIAASDYAFYMRMTHYNIGRPNYDICRGQLDLTRTALLRHLRHGTCERDG